MFHQPAVYIITNQKMGTLYTGVTANLKQRIQQHRISSNNNFSKKYGCKILVFYQYFSTMSYAIQAEKKLKAGSRAKKIQLIESKNPQWLDLYI